MNNIPETIQQQIICYLEAANFKAAKELRDHFLSSASQLAHQEDGVSAE